MALTINTNIMSLNAQRNLGASQTKLASAIERLSSGNRINSAKDDAAGLAISTRFTTQINGLNQAVRNANDGISLSQTTESALDEVTNNLQRIRELAVQSTNASNSASDRAALDSEVQQRLSEVTRIATQTNFNGMKVLDGSANQLSFQVGANVGEVITVGLDKGVKANQVGQLATGSIGGFKAAANTAGVTTASSVIADYTANFSITVDGQTAAVTGATDQASFLTKLNTALAGGTSGATASFDATNHLVLTSGTTGKASTAPVVAGTDVAQLGTLKTVDGVDAGSAAPVTLGNVTLQVGSNPAFSLSGTYNTAQDLADAVNAKSGDGINAYVGSDGAVKFASASTITVGGTAADITASGLTAGAINVATTTTLADSSIKTVDGANDTINRVDAALQSISDLRSNLGAVQNRFESTISNLQNISQNLTASKSAITDADFAQETANMSSAQILQQAGVSVLAQANQSQQIVQKLLQ
ncbi:flagellin N-terminal helical domain-containing protein [Luteibacter sp. UNCMF366Tsu5.1]|uniref:flagellin N-terminal helical domain-containing protein n=1 Tax=Luteibacter sp. UNCMF366Tsu5.1 TaxID=1502758 RepID=UPI000908EF38|nr:flagellin [Luteibacter sp. UNCMF366Tsu5.1]SFW37348.1 flagellin [Luteibacter sp. UNCMF366Tsu5.1]